MFDIHGSPAAARFTERSVLLSGGREQDPVTREWNFTETNFYVSPWIMERYINISVYDDVTRSYMLQKDVQDYGTAERLIRTVAQDYPGKIDVNDFLPMFKTFFDVSPGVLCVEDNLEDIDYSYSCDTCGSSDVNSFYFLLVPAHPETGLEASLNYHWEFGCFGGEAINGVFDDVKEEAHTQLNNMLQNTKKSYKFSVRKALAYLNNFNG